MITLATLSTATAQEVFDQVANHLLTQKQQSLRTQIEHAEIALAEICAYRGKTDFKCAAGCLISDDEYKAKFEGYSWVDLAEDGHVPREHLDLIVELQNIHDTVAVFEWPEVLENLANRLNLTYKSDAYGKV